MQDVAARLMATFRDILAAPALSPRGTAGNPEDPMGDEDAVSESFAGMFRQPCPQAFTPGLRLPDEIAVTWRSEGGVIGEVGIVNLLFAMHRDLDPSYAETIIDNHRLGNMRIADQVVDTAGPLHAVFELQSGKIAEQLYLFDSRELLPLELAYDAYLDMAATTRGIIYWQYLFAARPVTPGIGRHLSEGLDFLQIRFPSNALTQLRARLKARSRWQD